MSSFNEDCEPKSRVERIGNDCRTFGYTTNKSIERDSKLASRLFTDFRKYATASQNYNVLFKRWKCSEKDCINHCIIYGKKEYKNTRNYYCEEHAIKCVFCRNLALYAPSICHDCFKKLENKKI